MGDITYHPQQPLQKAEGNAPAQGQGSADPKLNGSPTQKAKGLGPGSGLKPDFLGAKGTEHKAKLPSNGQAHAKSTPQGPLSARKPASDSDDETSLPPLVSGWCCCNSRDISTKNLGFVK